MNRLPRWAMPIIAIILIIVGFFAMAESMDANPVSAFRSNPQIGPTKAADKEASPTVGLSGASTEAPSPTNTPQPTATSVPTEESTATVEPTNTQEPTNTPQPTATSVPTEESTATVEPTLEPTATSVPTEEPTATPEFGSLTVKVSNDSDEALEGANVVLSLEVEGTLQTLSVTSDKVGLATFNGLPNQATGELYASYKDWSSVTNYRVSVQGGQVTLTNNQGDKIADGNIEMRQDTSDIPEGTGSYVYSEGCQPGDMICHQKTAMSFPGAVRLDAGSCYETDFNVTKGMPQSYRSDDWLAFAPTSYDASQHGVICTVYTADETPVRVFVADLCANPFLIEGKPPVPMHDKPLSPPCDKDRCAPATQTPVPPDCENGKICPQPTPTCEETNNCGCKHNCGPNPTPTCEETNSCGCQYNCNPKPTPTCEEQGNCSCEYYNNCTCQDYGNCTCQDRGDCPQPTPTCQELGTCPTPETCYNCQQPPPEEQRDPPAVDPPDPVVDPDPGKGQGPDETMPQPTMPPAPEKPDNPDDNTEQGL